MFRSLQNQELYWEQYHRITIANNVFGYAGRLCTIYLDSSLLAKQIFVQAIV